MHSSIHPSTHPSQTPFHSIHQSIDPLHPPFLSIHPSSPSVLPLHPPIHPSYSSTYVKPSHLPKDRIMAAAANHRPLQKHSTLTRVIITRYDRYAVGHGGARGTWWRIG